MWRGGEAGHSLPSGARVKNEWGFTSISPYAFVSWYCSKHSDICTVSELKCHSASLTIAPILYLEVIFFKSRQP